MEGNNILAFAWGVAKLPGSLAYLALRMLNKQETLGMALQRLGWSSIERRNGPVLWFHVNGVGETSTVLPVVFRCLQEYNEKVTVLVTTPCIDVYKLLVEALPQRVLVQLVPMANPLTISAFLRKWQPQVGVFLETPFHRQLALMARESGVRLALLNAHMPGEDMIEWHARQTSREMLKQALRSYSLIVPRTYVDVGRFRMFGATLGQMPGWSTDLQQASELGACATRLLHQRPKLCRPLLKRLAKRQLWIAANTLPGEDVVVARIHAALRSRHKGLLTLIAPRVTSPADGRTPSVSSSQASSAYSAAARRVSAEKRLQVELLSVAVEEPGRLTSDVDVLVLDDPEALTALYSLSEVVLVGGSLLPSLDGASSPAAPAVAGCALLMGPHGAEFQGMATDLNHAAIMASDEVAAAVAQTGATMRGINPAGYDTPRESRAPEQGRGSSSTGVRMEGAAPRTGTLDSFGSTSVVVDGAVDGGAPGSSGPSWQQLMSDAHRPVRSSRPMSAPPTIPEFFGLRPGAPSFGLSPLGGLSYESYALQPGANGQTVLIAPFTTPGVPYGFGGPGLAAFSPEQATSMDFATPASAPTACGTNGNRTRRRAIDRFRWATSREVIGFGYTQDKDSEDSASASSTSDSEDEEPGVATARNNDGAPLTGHASAAGTCTKMMRDGNAHAEQSQAASGSEAPAPRDYANPQASSGRGSEDTRQPAAAQPAATNKTCSSAAVELPLAPPADPASRQSGDTDDGVGSEMDDNDFHDAVETDQVGEELVPQAVAVASVDTAAAVVTSDNATAVARAGESASASRLLEEVTAGLEGVELSEEALLSDAAGRQQKPAELSCEIAEVSTASAINLIGVKDAPASADGLQAPDGVVGSTNAAQRYKALFTSDETGGEVSARSLRVPQLAEDDGQGFAPALDDLPPPRGTHLGHLVICRDGGGADCVDELEADWPKRMGKREARHMVSDPGLPSDPSLLLLMGAETDAPCNLPQQWPIATSSVVDAVHQDSASAASCAASGTSESSAAVCSAPIAIQAASASADKSPKPSDLNDAALAETWANDVNMATIFEDEGAFPMEPAVRSVTSQPGSATAVREAYGIWAESPQPSFRGSLDHYLQTENPLALMASSPSATMGRAARGSLIRMALKVPTANGSMTNLVGLGEAAGTAPETGDEDQGAVLPECKEAAAGVGGVAGVGADSDGINGLTGDEPGSTALLPLPPRVAIGEDAVAADGDPDSNSSEPSPTVVSAAVPEIPVGQEEDVMGSSPTSFAASSGGGSLGSETTARRAVADAHPGCTAESPKSDFEFGGSVPDDTGSGSPTLLATASVHNGSGANLQSYIAADGQEVGSLQSEAAASSQSGAQRPNSRTSSPSSSNSWSESGPSRSPTRNGSPVMQPSRFQAPRQPVPGPSTGGGSTESSPYNAGSCFAGQTCFQWLPDGIASAVPLANTGDDRSRSVSGSGGEGAGPAELSSARGPSLSPAVSAASIGTRGSTGFHQVASIGSWLDHFGVMLPQPSPGLQRSQAQHDPRVWFSQQLGQRDASGGMPAPAVALEGVASGLRAPMHSPLRAFDDDRPLGFNPQALASVTTTLFPAAHAAPSYPAPLPPPAMSILSPRGAATSSSPLRPTSSVSSEQVTSAFTVGKPSQYSAAAAAGTGSGTGTFSPPPRPLPPPPPSAVAAATYPRAEPVVAAADTTRRSTHKDELSALLNSPRSPVSPVRVARVMSPAAEQHGPAPVGSLSSPVPAVAPTEAMLSVLTSPSQPQELWMHGGAPGGTSGRLSRAGEAPRGDRSPLPVALPSINTPRRELQRRMSMPVHRASPSSSPLRSTFSVVPGAAALLPVSPRAGGTGGLGLYNISSAADMAAGGQAANVLQSCGSDGSSDCPNTPTSRAADTASSPFRERRPVLQPPKSPNFHNDPERFEESFDAAVRAGPTKSPARPAGSLHVSPYSSPYKSPFAAAMASSVAGPSNSPGPVTAFRSLFLEEEEEELAAGQAAADESEDPEPLSPRANSHNVLFSMQAPRDDGPLAAAAAAAAAGPAAALRGASLRGGLSPGAGPLSPGPAAAPLPPPLPSVGSAAAALPSAFAQQVSPGLHRLSFGRAGGALVATSSTGRPEGPFMSRVMNAEASSLSQDTSAVWASRAAQPAPTNQVATAATAAASHGRAQAGNNALSINLDNAPTFSRIPSLADTDDDEGGGDTASQSRLLPHPAESLGPRQPRITLSGGLLVVPAVPGNGGGGSGSLQKSNLSQTSTPRLADSDSELEKEPSMGLPEVSIIVSDEADETPRASRSVDGSRCGSCSSIASGSGNNVGGGVRGSSGGGSGSDGGGVQVGGDGSSALAQSGSSAAGGMLGHGSAGSLASSSVAAGSPPRSPEQRTRCSESNCPSASPVKPPLHSTHSSPVPRSFISDAAPRNVPLPYMPALPSQPSPRSPTSPPPLSPRASTSGGGFPQVPSSPPASYMSPCVTDPRASPIKVMTAVKRTPADTPLRQDPLDVATFFAPFSSSDAAGLASSIFGGSAHSSTPDRRFSASAAAAGLGSVAPVRTQPAVGAPPSPTATAAAAAAAAGLGPTVFSQPTAPWLPRQELWPAGAAPDELLLSTRASAPAGFVTLADRARPQPHRYSGRRDVQPTLSPQSGAARQSQELYNQRTQQQQAWDRARAESRNASAAGTPRSARALFSGRESGREEARDGAPAPLPVSFSSSLCGYMDVVVSPVEAPPRSPRLRTSPTRPPPVFALDAAVSGQVETYSARDALTAAADEAWEVQQERQLHPYHAASAQGTPRSARVLFPPVQPTTGGGGTGAAGVNPGTHGLAEPPSPSWSQVSRRLFPEGGHRAASTATPDRRSVDELDEFLANMTVQVASPVSPQPRLPPPPLSPRVFVGGTPSGGARHAAAAAAAEAAAGPSSGAAAASGGRRPITTKRPSSPLLQTALLQQARKTSLSGEPEAPQRLSPQRNAPQPSYSGQSMSTSCSRSPAGAGSAQQQQQQQQMHPGAETSGAQQQHSVPSLPHLPALPPLPRLRQSPACRGASVSAVPAYGPSANWPPVLAHPAGMAPSPGGPQDAGSNATAEPSGRRMFRQSAPQLSQFYGPVPTSPRVAPTSRVSSIPLPGMPPVAEQEALAVLESQFMAAEQGAADLPIETRVVTPTALPVAGGSAGRDGPGVFAGATQGCRPNTAPDYHAAAPLSPRASPAAFGHMAAPHGRPFAGLGAVEMSVDLKPQAQVGGSGIVGESRGTAGASQGHAGTGGSAAAGDGLSAVAGKAMGSGTAAPGEPRAPQQGEIRPAMGQSALPPAATVAVNTLGHRQQHDGAQRCGPGNALDVRNGTSPAAAAPPVMPPRDRNLMQQPLSRTPERRAAAAGAVDGSPVGSTGGGQGPDREHYVAPCARYGDQYLIPAAHLTCDPRVGPAVWIVSNEDELASALSTLLRDPIERRSRGRAAAQGAARLASSLVTTVWSVLEDMVIAPALQEYITAGGARV